MNKPESADWHLTVEPRAWQKEALAAWEDAGQRGNIAVVTGAGKTILAEICMLAFLAQFPAGRIIVIVPTLALLDQWYVSLQDDLCVPPNDIAVFSGERKDSNPGKVNLVVLNTARTLAPRLAEDVDAFLIVDEVHRAASPMNALALRGEWKASLGMSATPERDYDSGFEDVIVPAIGEIIYRYDYRRAVHDGVISRFSLVNVEIPLIGEEQSRYDSLSRRIALMFRRLSSGEDVQSTLKRLLQQRAAIAASAVMRIPVTLKLVEQNRGARVLVFHERIDAAERLVHAFALRGVPATIYHSRMSAPLRWDNLRLFRRGVYDVLVTCRALDEGVNVPESTMAIIASSTASMRQRIQRLGRVLRISPGKDYATVYTLFATEVERLRLQRETSAEIGAESITWMRSAISSHGQAAN